MHIPSSISTVLPKLILTAKNTSFILQYNIAFKIKQIKVFQVAVISQCRLKTKLFAKLLTLHQHNFAHQQLTAVQRSTNNCACDLLKRHFFAFFVKQLFLRIF